MRILSLVNVTPWPPRGGIHLRILNLLQRIGRRHEVTLGCHVWNDADRDGLEELNRQGVRAIGGAIRYGSVRRHGVAALRAALRGTPPETAQYQTPELHALVRAGNYDLLHVEESILAPYAEAAPARSRVPRVMTLHNVHFLQDRRIARIEPTLRRRAWKHFNATWMRHYEPRMTRHFDRLIAVSEEDRAALQKRAPDARIEVVANGVDTHHLTPRPPHRFRPALLFIGSMGYRPCVDGAVWLVRDILPLVRRQHPDVDVWLVGRAPNAEVQALAGPCVFVTGEVDDVQPFYERATLALAPLRAGGGSRLKILEAMALGRAVVSTTLGAEGLRLQPGKHLAIADDAETMAATINALLDDAARRTIMEHDARALVEQEYDWDDLAERQLAIYDELARGSVGSTRH